MTPAFLTPLRLEKPDPSVRLWILTGDLVYRSAILGTIKVPKGHETDLASIPRFPLVYWLTGGRGDAAAVIHDCLYAHQEHGNVAVSRKTADAVFYEALGASGEPLWVRRLMYAGVRAFGWNVWRKRSNA